VSEKAVGGNEREELMKPPRGRLPARKRDWSYWNKPNTATPFGVPT
jgi:hypothetical protein